MTAQLFPFKCDSISVAIYTWKHHNKKVFALVLPALKQMTKAKIGSMWPTRSLYQQSPRISVIISDYNVNQFFLKKSNLKKIKINTMTDAKV